MRHPSLTRVLAIDLHPRRFGFVVLEGPDRLLDWGVRSCRRTNEPSDVLLSKRLRPLLELWRPTILAVHINRHMRPRQGFHRKRLLQRVVAEAKNTHVSVRTVEAVKGPLSRITKYERAMISSRRFPVLADRLPPKRRPWDSEPYAMSIFEALILAQMYATRDCRNVGSDDA